MITRYTYNSVTWLDVVSPTAEEVREIFEECAIPPDFVNDLTSMTPRTQTLSHKDALKITLDFPIVKRTDISHPHEVKFIATKKHLITVRFEDIEAIHRFAKEFEVLSILKSTGKRTSGGHLFLTLLGSMYTNLDSKLDYIESKMQGIENEMFNDQEKELLFEISNVGRRLISFQQTTDAHQAALIDLEAAITKTFGKTHLQGLQNIILTYHHLERRVNSQVQALKDLRETNNALLTTKQNEVMKIFTILAFITFPLTLFTSMFGMNTITTPIVGQEHDFWIILGIMAVVSIGFFAYFKYKRWI